MDSDDQLDNDEVLDDVGDEQELGIPSTFITKLFTKHME